MLSKLNLKDTHFFVKIFEALFVCWSIPQTTSELLKWTETMTEAFFLHKAYSTSESDKVDYEYMLGLLDKISAKVD